MQLVAFFLPLFAFLWYVFKCSPASCDVIQNPQFCPKNGLHSGLQIASRRAILPTVQPFSARKNWRVRYTIDIRGEKKRKAKYAPTKAEAQTLAALCAYVV